MGPRSGRPRLSPAAGAGAQHRADCRPWRRQRGRGAADGADAWADRQDRRPRGAAGAVQPTAGRARGDEDGARGRGAACWADPEGVRGSRAAGREWRGAGGAWRRRVNTVARPKQVRIIDVGPRDGLQNEPARIPTDVKIRYVDMLTDAGFGWIEVTSFVHPKAVPQMADADEVYRSIRKKPGVRYTTLVPNPRGLERAIAADVRDIALFVAATESFSRANINRSIAGSLDDAQAVIEAARPAVFRLLARLSLVFRRLPDTTLFRSRPRPGRSA